MPGIDQVLSIVVQQGADELRLATDEEPQMFAAGAKKRFVMAATPEPVLRHLLGALLSPERDAQLHHSGHVEFHHDAPGIGRFHVALATRQGKGFEVVFSSSASSSSAAVPTPSEQPSTAERAPGNAASVSETRAEQARSADARDGPAAHLGTVELDKLVMHAINARASDIHLADNEPPYLRIDGQLRKLAGFEAVQIDSLLAISNAWSKRLESGSAAEFSLDLNASVRLRVSVFRTATGLAAAVRLMQPQAPTLKSLNLPVSLENLAQVTEGLVLVCGATGAGKSSTLAALARHALEGRSIALVTLEDPIEFQLTSTQRSIVRQRQLGRDVVDFASGLRDALRGDPDVILVGELRDAETIRLALTAAETGHLVLASLHSGSAASCVERLIDAYPNEQRSQIRIQLAEALRAVVVQKLLANARGQGRVPVLEVLRVTHAVANVIREGKTAQLPSLIQAGSRDGMLSLERCLADCVHSGKIAASAARDAANDPDSLSMYLVK